MSFVSYTNERAARMSYNLAGPLVSITYELKREQFLCHDSEGRLIIPSAVAGDTRYM